MGYYYAHEEMMNEFLPDYADLPGNTLAEILEGLPGGVYTLANTTQVEPAVWVDVIKGRRAIDLELATKLELAFGVNHSFWLNRQQQYDETIARLALTKQA